jgi:MATE family multidrug resistance protein
MAVEQTIASVRVNEWPRARPGALLEVAMLAFPIVLQTLAETAMHVIDSAMIGRLGAAELGAVGFSGTWIWTLFVPFVGLATGVQVFVARHDGAREPAACGPWVWHALWLAVPAMTLWCCLIALCLPTLFAGVGLAPELRELAVSYGLGRLPGGPAVVASFALSSFFRGSGDTRTPLRAALIGILVNVVAAWLLIFGQLGAPKLGPLGAALAQSLGGITICAVLLHGFLQRSVRDRYQTQPRWPSRDPMLRFLRTSAPISGQWLLDMTTFAIFTSIVARMGASAMAASQAMLELLSVSFMQAIAIASAAGTLIGRYLGAGDLDAAARSYRSSQLLALSVAGAVAALFLAVPETLLGIFSDHLEVLTLARPLLVLGAFFQVVDAIGIVASGSLRGGGDTRWPLVAQASLGWLLRLPLVYIGAVVLGGGVFGAWGGELLYVTALAIVLGLRFQSGHWRSISI